MLALFFINLIVALNSFLIAGLFFSFENLADYLTALFLFYVAQIVLSLQALGILQILYLNQVFLLSVAFLAIGLSLHVFNKNKPNSMFKFSLRGSNQILFSNRTQLLCFSAIFGFFIVKVAINLINPPFGWDDLNYHFTFPVEWLKHGNLDTPISISGDPSVSYYPINASLFFLWFILPLKNVFIADLGQIPFFIVAFLAVYSIARKIGLNKEYAFLSSALFSLIPNYFKQLRIAYVDIIVAALFLMAFNFTLQAYREKSLPKLLLASIALGLMLGTKTTAMPLALLLLFPLLIISFLYFPKKVIPALGIILLGLITFGSFSYIRNIIQTGNPLYPLNFKIFNFTVFHGAVDNLVYRTGIRPNDLSLKKLLFSEGLGVQTILFVLPASLLAPLVIFKKRRPVNFLFNYLLFLPILLIMVFRFILPLPNIRYIYPLFALSMVIAFYLADILRVPKVLIRLLVIVCVLASMGENAKRTELVISLILTAAIFILFPFLNKAINRKQAVRILFSLSVIIILSLPVLEKDYITNEYPRYVSTVKYSGFWPDATKAWAWLNENTRHDNIAYIGRPVQFPLYGTNFKNEAYYVSVNQVDPVKLHYFPHSKYIWGYDGNKVLRNFEDQNNYRGNANYNDWFANLKRRSTNYLFVYSDLLGKGTEFPLEDAWARAHTESFKVVFFNETIRIYKIINE